MSASDVTVSHSGQADPSSRWTSVRLISAACGGVGKRHGSVGLDGWHASVSVYDEAGVFVVQETIRHQPNHPQSENRALTVPFTQPFEHREQLAGGITLTMEMDPEAQLFVLTIDAGNGRSRTLTGYTPTCPTKPTAGHATLLTSPALLAEIQQRSRQRKGATDGNS